MLAVGGAVRTPNLVEVLVPVEEGRDTIESPRPGVYDESARAVRIENELIAPFAQGRRGSDGRLWGDDVVDG